MSPEFPGSDRRHYARTLEVSMSRDGLPVEFFQDIDTQEPDKPLRSVNLSIMAGVATSIPIEVVTELGNGDVEQGIQRLAEAVCGIDYLRVAQGDVDPIFPEFIWPTLGINGESAY